jgi:hypothetical protein
MAWDQYALDDETLFVMHRMLKESIDQDRRTCRGRLHGAARDGVEEFEIRS